MTIVQLQYALSIAQYGNFTAAAESCSVTQPTLSMQIQKLEDELGVQIFDRTTHPIQPTKIGEFILDQARLVLQELDKIPQMVMEQKKSVSGTFTLGIIPTILPYLLPLFIRPFGKKYPKLHLVIKEMQTSDIINALYHGEIDTAIASTPLEEKSLIEKPLYKEPFIAYIPPGHRLHKESKISLEELKIDDILLLESGHCFRNNIINLCNHIPDESKVRVESGSLEAMISLSKEGLGMTLLPYLMKEYLSEEDKKNIREFEGEIPAREVSLVYSKNMPKLQVIEALKSQIDMAIKQHIFLEDAKLISPIV